MKLSSESSMFPPACIFIYAYTACRFHRCLTVCYGLMNSFASSMIRRETIRPRGNGKTFRFAMRSTRSFEIGEFSSKRFPLNILWWLFHAKYLHISTIIRLQIRLRQESLLSLEGEQKCFEQPSLSERWHTLLESGSKVHALSPGGQTTFSLLFPHVFSDSAGSKK